MPKAKSIKFFKPAKSGLNDVRDKLKSTLHAKNNKTSDVRQGWFQDDVPGGLPLAIIIVTELESSWN